jgi:hypothetical protein
MNFDRGRARIQAEIESEVIRCHLRLNHVVAGDVMPVRKIALVTDELGASAVVKAICPNSNPSAVPF